MKFNIPEELVTQTAAALHLTDPTTIAFLRTALENTVLFDAKHHDYGPGNIGAWGTFGVVVRMNDKFERIKHLFNKGRRRRTVNEGIRDSFRDISNYSIIAYLLETNQWPQT